MPFSASFNLQEDTVLLAPETQDKKPFVAIIKVNSFFSLFLMINISSSLILITPSFEFEPIDLHLFIS